MNVTAAIMMVLNLFNQNFNAYKAYSIKDQILKQLKSLTDISAICLLHLFLR